VRRKRLSSLEQPGAPPWMNSFADLMCLLLTFFVLLYSFSVLDVKKLESFLTSFQGQGVLHTENLEEIGAPGETEDLNPDKVIDPELLQLYREIMAYLEANQLYEDVDLKFVSRGLVLTIKHRLLFDSGKAVLREDSKIILSQMAGLFSQLDHDIAVEGHTDNIPINRALYPTNWELSTARATSVVRFFTEEKKLDAQKFAAVGFGEWQPVAPNDTEENRQLNRRVVIKIYTDGEGHRIE
jgi:chemotaxis protein MotB